MATRSILRIPRLCALLLAALALPPNGLEAQLDVPFDSVRIDGGWLAYRDVGSGEPLLLLHGFMGSGRMWDRIGMSERFASTYQVIVPASRRHRHGRMRSLWRPLLPRGSTAGPSCERDDATDR